MAFENFGAGKVTFETKKAVISHLNLDRDNEMNVKPEPSLFPTEENRGLVV
jgi:hypothetical protein